jgi:hypothetical protein
MSGAEAGWMGAREDSLRYEGWRVAVAAGVGVFVSFESLRVYTFGSS